MTHFNILKQGGGGEKGGGISVTARATKDRVMHYPSAFSEAFAEALVGAGRGGERKDGERGGPAPLRGAASGGGDEPSPQVAAESDD